MSSDTFHIQIRKIEGDIVELLCTTSTAGGYSDYAVTRSFVLMALEDGMPYQKNTPLQKRLVELGSGSMPPCGMLRSTASTSASSSPRPS